MDVTLICSSQAGNTRKVGAATTGACREARRPSGITSLKTATDGDLLGVGARCLSIVEPPCSPPQSVLCRGQGQHRQRPVHHVSRAPLCDRTNLVGAVIPPIAAAASAAASRSTTHDTVGVF